MATGDIKWFAQALADLGNKQFDLSNDTLKLGITNAAIAPSVDTPAPHWGGTGTTNLAANQVATGTAYTGPITLTNKTWSLQAGGPKLRADIVNIAQDLSGFTNAAYGYIIDDTDVKKRVLGWVELSAAGTLSITGGPANIDWNGVTNDILAIAQS